MPSDPGTDILNRYPRADWFEHTETIMKYIFPRQFNLHNVFTSDVDPKETAQPFKDYTLREQEIRRQDSLKNMGRIPTNDAGFRSVSALPKRLREGAFELVRRMHYLHKNCSYSELLHHYCPHPVRQFLTSLF